MLAVRIRGYPWDVVDEDLERLHGEVGVSGVSIWAAAPPVLQLRARTGLPRHGGGNETTDSRLVRSAGGLMFRPHARYYGATRCKPVTAEELKGRSLERIAAACSERGLELRVIVSVGRMGRIAGHHPEMACRNVYGDRSSLSVCLMNPDVQAFLAGVVADLASNYAVSGVCLADFSNVWGEASSPDLRTPVPLGQTGERLLSLCFCESCHQKGTAANVDVVAAQRSAQSMLEAHLQDGDDARGALDPSLAGAGTSAVAPELAEFLRWRDGELGSLLDQLIEACQPPLFLCRTLRTEPRAPTYAGTGPAAGGGPQGGPYASPAGVITAIHSPEQLDGAFCTAARRNELCLPASMAIGRHAPELVSALARATAMGFSGFEIDDLASLPIAALTAVKQAIRFARRTET